MSAKADIRTQEAFAKLMALMGQCRPCQTLRSDRESAERARAWNRSSVLTKRLLIHRFSRHRV